MDNGTILHIDPMAYSNGIYVPANHCLKPNAAIVAHDDISDNGCIFSQIDILPKNRRISVYRLN
jgi:hypothetical protein